MKAKDIGYGILSTVVALAVYPFVMREMRKQYPYAFVDYDKLMRKVWFGSIVLTILTMILWVVLK